MKLKPNCGGAPCKCSKRSSGHALRSHLSKGELRHENLQGKSFLVVPVVMAKAGVVMNGMLTLAEELLAEGWNGRPVTVGHPIKENEKDGFTTANSPDELKAWCVGQLFNTVVENGVLKSEAWIDLKKAEEVHPGLVKLIKSSKPLEVSTGFFAKDEPSVGVSEGKPYEVISRNWVPDHLALLPDEEGACNWADGCGVRSNTRKSMSKSKAAAAKIVAALGLKANAAKAAKRKIERVLLSVNKRNDDAAAAQVVAELIADPTTAYTPADEESLMMLAPETLAAVVASPPAAPEEPDAMEGEEDEEIVAEEGDEEEEVVAETDDEEEVIAETDENEEELVAEEEADEEEKPMKRKKKTNRVQQLVDAAVAKALRGHAVAIRAASKIATDHRTSLIAKVTANSRITRKQALKMNTATLEVIAGGLVDTAPSYNGMPMPHFNSDDSEARELVPTGTLAAIKARANAGKKRSKEMH